MKESLRNKIIKSTVGIIIVLSIILLTLMIVMTGCNHKCEKDIIDDYPLWLEEEPDTPHIKEPMFMLSDLMMDSVDMDCGE